jgi:hypothetical protein
VCSLSAMKRSMKWIYWADRTTAPRFKGKPNFDFSQHCPQCGEKIQPNEMARLSSTWSNAPVAVRYGG